MKRKTSLFLGLAIALAMFSPAASASAGTGSPAPASLDGITPAQPLRASTEAKALNGGMPKAFIPISESDEAYKIGEMKITGQQGAASPAAISRGTRTKSVASVADLAGEYVATYEAYSTDSYDSGEGVTITQIEGTDSIQIADFLETGITIKAKVDTSAMTISIPNQVMGYNVYYGYYDIAYCTTSGTPSRTAELEGTISSDGVITITSPWGAFLTDESYSDYYLGVWCNTVIEPANATMSHINYNTSSSSYTTTTYNVVATQTATNVLSIKNFINFGQTVDITLRSDSTALISCQMAANDVTNGDWYTYGVTYASDWSGIESYTKNIECDKATDLRTITWGAWNIICTYYYYYFITGGSVSVSFDISYPEANSVTTFDGEGTESSPYLVKTLNDMQLLADNVNSADTDSTGYARAYAGQYFRLENDIDMSGYRFTPIGYDDCQKFAGTFDGNSYTLSNLNVNAGGYAGLFGNCDTASVIKNLTLADPAVTSSLTYAGGIAAYSLGTIENCHVTGGTIHNSYTGTGGIAGLAYDINGCSVTGATIEGLGGYAGGVAGQVNVSISNCNAINTDVTVSGLASTYPSGGVVGNAYYATVEKCYFSGNVDGTGRNNLQIGGVAGRCYFGSVTKCYAVGTVVGQGTTAAVGGVVGFVRASTISCCYSAMQVEDESSPRVGGITGYLISDTDDNDNTIQCAVTNCYSASCVVANTDSYDTTTERRETLGTISDSSSPTLSNLYYDNQLTDYGSAEYGASTSTLTSADGLTGFDSSVWTYAEGYYPRLAGMDDTDAAKLAASALVLDGESPLSRVSVSPKINLLGSTTAYLLKNGTLSSEGYYSQIEGDSITFNTIAGIDTLCLMSSTAGMRVYYMYIVPTPFDGNGTQSSPYLIQTKSDLIYLSEITTIDGEYFPDTYFLMTCDIDLEADTAFLGICADGTSSGYLFEGCFDGGGHAIHNMKLPESVVWTTAPEDATDGLGTANTSSSKSYNGFIGRLATTGTLKNLTIAADCQLTGHWQYTGALVGLNRGTIDSCVNLADVSSYYIYVGGITGYNYYKGEITNCYNAGNVTSARFYSGGIAGANYGLIKGCQNAGNIEVKEMTTNTNATTVKYAGGIAGSCTGGRFDNCVNLGMVSGYDYIGGISGTLYSSTSTSYYYKNDVINCINYGAIMISNGNSSYVGNIGGTSGTTGTLADIYYDAQITRYSAHGSLTLSNTTAAETSVLISGTALDNYSTDTWDFTAGSYPVLKVFADQDATKALRSAVVSIASGETVADLKTNAILNTANDCVWTLKVGTAFTILGDTLVIPTNFSEVAIDTLVATIGSYSKAIVIKAIPDIPLQGDGTADSPYLITTPAEWNSLAAFIAASSTTLTGYYVQIAADLDFTDTEMTPMGYDRITAIDCDLDGNGKTIKGFSSASDASYYGPVAVLTGENFHLHDLTVDGETSSATTYTAGVVGKLYGKLTNVTSSVAVTSSANYTAGVVAYAYAGAYMENCVNEDTVASSGTYTSGVVAYSESGVKYVNCGNKGVVNYTGSTASSYTSGLVGYCLADSFIGCYNEGPIVITNSTTVGGVGGLIAYAYGKNSSAGTFYFKNCYNAADITGAYNLAGLIRDTYSYTMVTMDSCYNSGDITGTGSTTSSIYLGGISTEYNRASSYTNCWNSGAISSQSTGSGYIGGLFAYFAGSFSTTASAEFVNCWNSGDLSTPNSEKLVVGGILGYANNFTTLDGCYNTGNVTGGYRVGGLAGQIGGSTAELTNCWNAGDVSANLNYVGGIVGYSTVAATLSSCFNVGNVSSLATSSSTICAVGGIAGQSGMTITNVYNAGDITGLTYAGGLIGLSYKSNGSITGGYSTGKISSTDGYCGNLMGNGMDNTSYWASSKNTMSGTYYLSANAVECTDTASVGLSYAELAELDMGDGWTAGDNYTYPRITSIADNDYAKAHAAAVIPADSTDVYSAMTGVFYLGAPDGVTWAADNSVISYDGQMGYFNADYAGGTITMTATSGDVSVTTELVYGVTTGVESVLSDSGLTEAEIVSETLYNTSGQIVTAPADGQKAIYIVRRVYSDGAVTTVKEAR